MLTISQLASYAGVTVRAVRHYHAKGLLPEPERDHSGYRRYDAAAVVELVKIRTRPTRAYRCRGCASCWRRVTSSRRRSRTSTAACAPRFANASDTGERIAQLAAGDSSALPPRRSPTSTGCASSGSASG